MGRVYRQADEVIVWLGPIATPLVLDTSSDFVDGASDTAEEPYGPEQAIEVLTGMAAGLYLHELPYFGRCMSTDCGSTTAEATKSWFDAAESIIEMLDVPWFTRTWVVQEIVLAREAVLMYGHCSIPWDLLVAAWSNWDKHRQSCCSGCNTTLSTFDSMLLHRLASQTIQIENARRRGNSPSGLVRLLQDFSARKATDNRDKIFGLLGVLPEDTPLKIVPEYTASVVEVYTQFAWKIIQAYGWLAPLHLELDHNIPGLPSWVPDWTYCGQEPVDYFVSRFLQAQTYRAAPFTGAQSVTIEGGTLRVKGLRVDIIASVSVVFTPKEREEEHLNLILDWRHFLDLDRRKNEPYVSGRTLYNAYQATVFADRCQDGPESRQSTDNDFEDWQSHLTDVTRRLREEGPNIAGKLERSMAAHNVAVLRRRLFVAAKGYIGLCPADASVGDGVYVLDDAPAPIFVRHAGGGLEGNPHHRVVQALGHGYVHGLMEGEAERMALPRLVLSIE